MITRQKAQDSLGRLFYTSWLFRNTNFVYFMLLMAKPLCVSASPRLKY
jgi:hypothetical protein